MRSSLRGLLLLALLLVPAAPAAAGAPVTYPCDSVHTDLRSSGMGFELYNEGYAGDTTAGFADDTFDRAGVLLIRVDGVSATFGQFESAPSPLCTLEEDGREVVFPPMTSYRYDSDGDSDTYGDPAVASAGVALTRKAYVPRVGGWARWVDTLTNTTGSPLTLDLAYWSDHYEDSRAQVSATSSGDSVLTPLDSWATIMDGDGTEPPETADGSVVWQGDTAPTADRIDRVTQAGIEYSAGTAAGPNPDRLIGIFDDIVLEPGESVTYMHLVGQHEPPRSDAAASAAARLAALPLEVQAGLTQAEITAVRNWPAVGDGDRDGRGNDADNCVDVANGDQANLDGDALGDACDPDRDGDGLSDAAEAAFGTNPSAADSDADGVADAADRCPVLAGPDGGCPPLNGPGAPAQVIAGRADPAAAVARLTRTRDRKAPFSFTVTGSVTPPQGLSAEQACGASKGRVRIQAKRGKRTIATRRVALRGDCTFRATVKLRRGKKLGKARKVSLVPTFLGNRFLEPVRLTSLTARVG